VRVSIADAARELDELTAVFLAGFYRVAAPSGSAAPELDALLQSAAQPSDDLRFGWIITRASTVGG